MMRTFLLASDSRLEKFFRPSSEVAYHQFMKSYFLILITVSLLSTLSQASNKSEKLSSSELSALKAGASKGDAKSQLEYGKAIRATNREEAANWIQKAADQGSGEAWYWLGYAGLGKEQPIVYYEKAAETGYAEAYGPLFDELLFRAGSSADIAKAKKFADLARKTKIKVGYDSGKTFQTIDRCFEAGSPVIPKEDQPTPEEKKSFRASKVECFQYQHGIDAEKDSQLYRKCLLSNDEVDNNSLAEIYANGWRVKRNAKLAIALVCHGSNVPAELTGMVETLYTSKDEESLEQPFTFCDHVTSGMNGGFCAAEKEKIASKLRDGETASLTEKWTKPQKAAFQTLQKRAEEFFVERASSEQDMSGSARAQIAIDEEARLRSELLGSVKSFESGHLPQDRDFATTDKELNEIYSKLMRSNQHELFGTVTKENIKVTQRKWIKYRDAFVKFATLKYPKISSDIWKTWLTRQRIDQLKENLG